MATTDPTTLGQEGCSDARFSSSATHIILDFGTPYHYVAATGQRTEGTLTFHAGTTAQKFRGYTKDIEPAILAYAQSYQSCSFSGQHMTVDVGTNNCDPSPSGNCPNTTVYFNQYNATALATMIMDLNTKLVANGYGRVDAGAAVDREVDWNTLLNSYTYYYYYYATAYPGFISRPPLCGSSWAYNSCMLSDYGDAAGCPLLNGGNGACDNGWSVDSFSQIANLVITESPSNFYIFVHFIPEIYNQAGAQADQWANINQWIYDNYPAYFNWIGFLTQYGACQTNGPCTGTDNTPAEAWVQVYDALTATGNAGNYPLFEIGSDNSGQTSDITYAN